MAVRKEQINRFFATVFFFFWSSCLIRNCRRLMCQCVFKRQRYIYRVHTFTLSKLILGAGETGSTRCSPMHASRTSVASSLSFPQALNAVRSSPPITPITQLSVQDAGNQRDQRSRNLLLDLTVMSLQEPDEEPVDKEEVGGRNCKFTRKSTSTSVLAHQEV